MATEAAPRKVLVVDDDPAMRRMVEHVLQLDGLHVCTAANGAECLVAVGAESPDLVILDVNMPVMDGLEALCCSDVKRGAAVQGATPA